MNNFMWFFMSGKKKLLYQIECAKENKQRLYLPNGIVLDFTEDYEKLLKERAGLKLHCADYKRKYKSLNRIIGRIYRKIDGLKVQYGIMLRRRTETNSNTEKEVLTALIKQNQDIREELQNIYDNAREVK